MSTKTVEEWLEDWLAEYQQVAGVVEVCERLSKSDIFLEFFKKFRNDPALLADKDLTKAACAELSLFIADYHRQLVVLAGQESVVIKKMDAQHITTLLDPTNFFPFIDICSQETLWSIAAWAINNLAWRFNELGTFLQN